MNTSKIESTSGFTDRALPDIEREQNQASCSHRVHTTDCHSGVPANNLPTHRSKFEEWRSRNPRRVWHDFPRLIILYCLLLGGLVIFPALHMYHLAELPTMTDATGSVVTGGIFWRLLCYVCLLLLFVISCASHRIFGLVSELFLYLWAAEMVVGGIIWVAVSNEPGSKTSKGCRGDVCLSNVMFYASVVTLIFIANITVVAGVLIVSNDEDGWDFHGEIVGLRDIVRAKWQGYRSSSS